MAESKLRSDQDRGQDAAESVQQLVTLLTEAMKRGQRQTVDPLPDDAQTAANKFVEILSRLSRFVPPDVATKQ